MHTPAKVTGPQREALREIALHVPGDRWPPRGMTERLEAKGLITVTWHRNYLGAFVWDAALTAAGHAALGLDSPGN